MAKVTKRRGKWVCDFSLAGKRQPLTFDTKAEAEAFKRELLLRRIDNQIGYRKVETKMLPEAVKQYLGSITVTKEIRTQEVDRKALGDFAEEFRQLAVQAFQLQDLEQHQIRLLKGGLKGSSVNRKYNVIRHFFKKCHEWKYCVDNPTIGLTKLKEAAVVRIPLTESEINRIISELPAWAASAFYFVAKTGVRRGVVCKLTWNEVNFETNTLVVESLKGGVRRVTQLPMSDDLRQFMLMLWNMRAKRNCRSEKVFLNANNNPIIPSTLTRVVINLRSKGIQNVGIHIARHTLLTDLSSVNQSGAVIQKIAGHSSLNTSQKYVHHNTSEVKLALEKVGEQKQIISPLKLVSGSG